MKQVITIGSDGSIRGLDHKSKGLDLRKLGKVKIRRVTLIEWEERHQLWSIRWMRGDGELWTFFHFDGAGVDERAYGGKAVGRSEVVYFPDYEDAVAAEVAMVQSMQLAGEEEGLY